MRINRQVNKTARRTRQSAFTLVEMLLVLVILATLAAVVVPKFTGRTRQAKITAAETQISNFELVLDVFEADNGFYPSGRGGLEDLIIRPNDAQNWQGPYYLQWEFHR